MVKWKLNLNDHSCLSFEVADDNWAQVHLDVSNECYVLGAEDLTVITKKLLSGFQEYPSRKIVGDFDGLGVVWVLSLAEKHSSVYLARTEGQNILFFQDAEGKLFSRIELTPSTVNLLDTTPQAAPPPSWLRG